RDGHVTGVQTCALPISFQPTIARTSQKETMTAVNGRIRPAMAFRSDSGSAVTAARVWIGVPMAPQATGAVLAIRLSAAAWNGLRSEERRVGEARRARGA